MIPKKIHYMWFGGNPLPESTKKYIDSWRKFCPDYEIKEWNESNFDIHCCKYVEEAYSAKKWAFVVDYVRFYILYNEGGIYLETDTEIIRDINILRTHKAFFGRAGEDMTLPIIGLEAGSQVGRDMMSVYENSSFILPDGSYNYKTVNQILFELLRDKYDMDVNELRDIQILNDDISIYPEKYLYGRDSHTGVFKINPDLFVIHYADATWLPSNVKNEVLLRRRAIRLFGEKIGVPISDVMISIKQNGILCTIKKVSNKLLRKLPK